MRRSCAGKNSGLEGSLQEGLAPMLFWHHGHVAHTYLHASSGESRLECVTARQLNLAYPGFPRARETTSWLVMPGQLRRKAIFHKGGSFLSISDAKSCKLEWLAHGILSPLQLRPKVFPRVLLVPGCPDRSGARTCTDRNHQKRTC